MKFIFLFFALCVSDLVQPQSIHFADICVGVMFFNRFIKTVIRISDMKYKQNLRIYRYLIIRLRQLKSTNEIYLLPNNFPSFALLLSPLTLKDR